MTTQWTISTLERETSNGFVITAHWQATATDGDYTASIYSTCSWAEGTPTIAYADLTQEQVLGWCYANGVDQAATEAAIQANIDNQINPPIVQPPLPWANPLA